MNDEASDKPPVATDALTPAASVATRTIFSEVLARARLNAHKAAERGWVKPPPVASDVVCPRCTGTGYLMGRDAEFAVARLCICREDCPECRGARYLIKEEKGYEVAAPCSCTSFVQRVGAFNDAQIPAGYAQKRLTPSGPGDVHGFSDRGLESLKRAKAALNLYRLGMVTDQMKGLLLIGGLGLGKTHLVCSLLSYFALERGIACRFIDYSDLMARIRATFDDGSDEKQSVIIEALVQTPVLAIDDLGKGQGTNWELSILDQIVTRRYNARRIILATTNYLPEDQLDKRHGADARKRRDLSEALEDRIGERLASRLRAACDFHVLEGADYRVHGLR